MKKLAVYDSSVNQFRTYTNIDLDSVNEYCFVQITANTTENNAPCFGRVMCTPQDVGFQIAVAQNDGTLYVRGHNWMTWSDWKAI